MSAIRIARSFIAADSLAELIQADYAFAPPVRCQLLSKMLRTQDNDHYLVTTGQGQRYVARIYQNGDQLERQESDYLYELDWLQFLKSKELPVAYPIARTDGRYLGGIQAPEGQRYYALFSRAEGVTMSPDNEEQLFAFGGKMAQIHVASNEYAMPHARQPMDLNFLADQSIARLHKNWGDDRRDDLNMVIEMAEQAKAEIEALIKNPEHTPDSWGPIGGDFHPNNVHFDEKGQPTFFNFDLCGPGWRAYDIAAFLLTSNLLHEPADYSEAFFAGYYSVRPLSKNEHRAISPFMTLRRVWLTGYFSRTDGLIGHTFLASA
jgi:Ser/Thr protein kinase RdoA (MazF antagonist)